MKFKPLRPYKIKKPKLLKVKTPKPFKTPKPKLLNQGYKSSSSIELSSLGMVSLILQCCWALFVIFVALGVLAVALVAIWILITS